jgi:putative ABC transport system substrate-binding protein
MRLCLRRREFIAGLGGAAAWPLTARAQRPAMPVIGLLLPGTPESMANYIATFRKGLNEIGFVEGRNVVIEYRWAYDQEDRLRDLAAELVRLRVAVIAIIGSSQASVVAKAATTSIPIVFQIGGDPVQIGLVASLNRPGGNVTGITTVNADLVPKQLGLVHELMPRAGRFGLLVNPNYPFSGSLIADARSAAMAIGLQIEILAASTNRGIDAAFADIAQRQIGAVLVAADPLFGSRRVQIVALAAHYRVPTIYPWRDNTEVGGLLSYGTNLADAHRQVGIYTGRILKGEKPADLPVMQATKFEFIINLHTARLLGLDVPATLLAIADEVIE